LFDLGHGTLSGEGVATRPTWLGNKRWPTGEGLGKFQFKRVNNVTPTYPRRCTNSLLRMQCCIYWLRTLGLFVSVPRQNSTIFSSLITNNPIVPSPGFQYAKDGLERADRECGGSRARSCPRPAWWGSPLDPPSLKSNPQCRPHLQSATPTTFDLAQEHTT
jgi:hypothetical protein